MTDFWPHLILRPRDITRQYLARTTVGTVAASGFTQRVASPAGAWRIDYDGIVISTASELRHWDTFEAALDGGAVAIYVPLIAEGQGTVDGALVGAHSQGSTTMVIRRIGDIIGTGYHVTVGNGRLHRVISVTALVNDYTCVVRPPLRADYPGATVVEIEMPICKCRLASDDAMRLTVTPGRLAVGSVKFLEDPN
jgi:hypothetical protein